jgi:hypothetical protein
MIRASQEPYHPVCPGASFVRLPEATASVPRATVDLVHDGGSAGSADSAGSAPKPPASQMDAVAAITSGGVP